MTVQPYNRFVFSCRGRGVCCEWKPGLMVVSTVANMILTLFQAVLIHVNTLITIVIGINCSVSPSCNNRNNYTFESKRYGKQLLTPLRLIARINFSLKNYCCELLNLTGMVGKVGLISTFATTVYESWHASDKYTWDNAGDL